ncbi:TetR/AcrR family transcriptional regulator [Cryptosporangium phraense]|uniref:TetR/AcrR family transcriptional regulator n=1 Tax=Cryptosporangium phraense TaxID=2593070 RepID=A0A545AME3_9ACTN|nr:TetR/AcrR family transcriptional regulator [Cryptosporangium phraense]
MGTAEPDPGASRHRAGVRSGDLGGRIVAAAAELLDETGDHASVSLRSIARRAGVSAPAIYGHYANVQSIFLVVVQEAFAELEQALRDSADRFPDEAGAAARQVDQDDPQMTVARLHAVCDAYLDFAVRRPQRYRIMFGGLWTATTALESSAVTRREVEALGQEALGVIVAALQGCIDAGVSTSTDAFADAVALWLGLHGLAHQRVAAAAFPWPGDIARRLISALAHVTGD